MACACKSQSRVEQPLFTSTRAAGCWRNTITARPRRLPRGNTYMPAIVCWPRSRGGAVQYYHKDHLSVRVITDSAGHVIGQQGNFPFGEFWYSSGTTTKWKFTTYERDQESGLDYALARLYNSRIASFCSADPVEGKPTDPQSWNRYTYARNDPINGTDPSGKFLDWLFGFFSWLFNLLSELGTQLGSAFGVLGQSTTAVVSEQEVFIPDAGVPFAPVVGGVFRSVTSGTFGWTVTQVVTTTVNGATIGGYLAGGAGLGAMALQASPTSKSAQQPQQKPNCPQVPEHPPGVNVDDNIRLVEQKWQAALDLAKAEQADFPQEAYSSADAQQGVKLWFVNKVLPRGDWDYKTLGSKYDTFGNFNFGATGSVFWDQDTLLRGAGALKMITSRGKFGTPWTSPDYGNQPEKNEQIKQGIQYYKNHCGNF